MKNRSYMNHEFIRSWLKLNTRCPFIISLRFKYVLVFCYCLCISTVPVLYQYQCCLGIQKIQNMYCYILKHFVLKQLIITFCYTLPAISFVTSNTTTTKAVWIILASGMNGTLMAVVCTGLLDICTVTEHYREEKTQFSALATHN